jgi:hypothetical protein
VSPSLIGSSSLLSASEILKLEIILVRSLPSMAAQDQPLAKLTTFAQLPSSQSKIMIE